MSLSDKERQDFALPEDHRKGEFVIAAKFLTSRFLQMEAVARTFKQIWRFNNGFRIRNQGNNTVLFVFDNFADVDKILNSQPWSFDKHLIIMQRYTNDSPVSELAFNRVPFWVQVHDIPCSFLTRKVAEKLCDTVGEVQKSIGAVEDDGGSFFRVRVMVDVTLPLCRGRVISLPNGKKSWVKFKYERLPNVCYWCGRLDHDDRDCEIWVESQGTLTTDQQQFGPSLRAPPYKTAGRDVIYVPGYFEGRARRPQGRTVVAGPVEVAPDMEVEGIGGAITAETVACHESTINSGGASVTTSSLNHASSFPDLMQPMENNSGSNDSGIPANPNVIDAEIKVSNSGKPVEKQSTLNNVNLGINLGDSNLMPEIIGSASTSRVSKVMKENLVDSNLDNPAHNHTINDPLIPAVDGEVSQSANLRTWKRLIRLPKPNEAENRVERGTKRKASPEFSGLHDVPNKRMQVICVDQYNSNVLVEAVEQPRQEP